MGGFCGCCGGLFVGWWYAVWVGCAGMWLHLRGLTLWVFDVLGALGLCRYNANFLGLGWWVVFRVDLGFWCAYGVFTFVGVVL